MRGGWLAAALVGCLGITPVACTPTQNDAPGGSSADVVAGGPVSGIMGRSHGIRLACPKCGRRYDRSKTVCPHDGNPLVER